MLAIVYLDKFTWLSNSIGKIQISTGDFLCLNFILKASCEILHWDEVESQQAK